jgi:hypothetical protein
MKYTKFYLIGFGVLSMAFGLAYLLVPVAMSAPAGFGDLSASAKTDVRATYGGFQIGLAGYLLWAARAEKRFHAAVLLIALSIGSVLASRVFGLIFDGVLNDFHLSGLIVEVSLTVSAIYFLRRLSRKPAPSE